MGNINGSGPRAKTIAAFNCPAELSKGTTSHGAQSSDIQPLKRPRHESFNAPPPPQAPYGQPEVEQDGPRTLHLGGLPPGLTQEDLDRFLTTNFYLNCVGGKLTDRGGSDGRGTWGRAFVGFNSHHAAVEAQSLLQGFKWEGAVLRAEWARSEYRPSGVGKGHENPNEAFHPPPQSPAQPMWAASDASNSTWGNEWASTKATLHFTNLPYVTEAEFDAFLTATFPDQVACARFVHSRDGRPPVAWVLFVSDWVAERVVSSHQTFDWKGSQVLVQYARTELDPTKCRR